MVFGVVKICDFITFLLSGMDFSTFCSNATGKSSAYVDLFIFNIVKKIYLNRRFTIILTFSDIPISKYNPQSNTNNSTEIHY